MTNASRMLLDWYTWTGVKQPSNTDAFAYLDCQLEKGTINEHQHHNMARSIRFWGLRTGYTLLTGELMRVASETNRSIAQRERRAARAKKA